jgi:hypothetical protein
VQYRQWLGGIAVAVACAGLPAAAGATTIETFTFSEGNWSYYDATGAGSDDGGRLEGTFTGVLDADGRIPLGNILSFSVLYTNRLGVTVGTGLTLDFFSFDATPFDTQSTGTSSSLDFIVEPPNKVAAICVGAAATLSPDCHLVYGGPNTKGVVTIPTAQYFSSDAPVLTLVSRWDSPDTPPPSTVPEPGMLVLFGTGLTAVGATGRQRFRR